jgi:hypothetical protein
MNSFLYDAFLERNSIAESIVRPFYTETWRCGFQGPNREKQGAHNYAVLSVLSRIIRTRIPGIPAKMPKRDKPRKNVLKPLDASSIKRGRGRPEKIPRSWVTGRAANYRKMLATVWSKLEVPLLAAETEEQVVVAFENHAEPFTNRFVPQQVSEILALIQDRRFPKRAKARIGFLADSLPGRPEITARRSRDICAEERAKQRAKSPHKVLRKEFYIECSCGYKGPALDDACRKCRAEIPISLEDLLA